MATARPPFILFALVLCALAASANAHGKGKTGDGFYQPLKSNGAWKLYSFEVTDKNKQITSLRLMPDSTDPLDAGTINTATGELFDANDNLVGINSLVRTVVGDDPLAGSDGGERVLRGIVQLVFEFGSKEAGFFDDTITVTSIIKPVVGGSNVFDYDGQVTGGGGRFKGATGTMSVVDVELDDNLSVVATKLRFEVYVPNNFPKL